MKALSREHYTPVDHDAEIQALAKHLEAYWHSCNLEVGFEALVRYIYTLVLEDGPHWSDTGNISNALIRLKFERQDTLMGLTGDFALLPASYDGLYTLLDQVTNGEQHLSDQWQKDWDYDAQRQRLQIQTEAAFPSVTTVMPLGYELTLEQRRKLRVCSGGNDDAFTGHNTSNACSGGFAHRVGYSEVRYNDEECDYPPYVTLIHALHNHVRTLVEYNCDCALMEELKSFDVQGPFINRELVPATPLLSLLAEQAGPLCGYVGPASAELLAQYRAQQDELDALSPEEREARVAAGIKKLGDTWNS